MKVQINLDQNEQPLEGVLAQAQAILAQREQERQKEQEEAQALVIVESIQQFQRIIDNMKQVRRELNAKVRAYDNLWRAMKDLPMVEQLNVYNNSKLAEFHGKCEISNEIKELLKQE